MRLKELREERELTQNEVAKAIQTSQSNIGRWEKGLNEPASNYVIKLANLFEVTTDYLLGLTEDGATPRLTAPASAALPLDETELLKNYRALSYVGKARVAAYADLMREQEESAKPNTRKKA